MIKRPSKNKIRVRKHARVRKTIFGTEARPRLCVFRSLKHTYAQLIDDEHQATLVAASTRESDVLEAGQSGGNVEAAKKVGQAIASRAKAKGIDEIVFDRSGYIYHGRVKALADAARDGGLSF